MIAMVMCAGLGTRLRPLTYSLPKPMVPVANRPVLAYTLENLKKHGVDRVVINLSYMPEVIQNYFGDGSRWGLKIHYSLEKEPLGTAGGVKNVEKIFQADPDPDFLITSGDGLTDIDFGKFLRFHKAKKSLGTIGMSRVDSRLEYGVTLTGANGRIQKFVEKPFWSQFLSNTVNTGLYAFHKNIFREIPAATFYDFGKQLWPKMLKNKKPIYGYEFKEFWTDIGTLEEYRRAQRAVLNGEVKVRVAGKQVRPGVWVDEGTVLPKGLKLKGPCLVGKYCKISKNATISPHSVIGDRCELKDFARTADSVLWKNVRLGKKSGLDGCIVTAGEKIPDGISIFDATITAREAGNR